MEGLGQHLTQDEIKAMIDQVDKDGNGVIDYDEFSSMLEYGKKIKLQPTSSFRKLLDESSNNNNDEDEDENEDNNNDNDNDDDDEIKKAFILFDKDHDGYIGKKELKECMISFRRR